MRCIGFMGMELSFPRKKLQFLRLETVVPSLGTTVVSNNELN